MEAAVAPGPAPSRPGTPVRVPTSFPYWRVDHRPGLHRANRWLRRHLGAGLLPTDAQAAAYTADMFRSDPLAERFVDEVLSGPGGRRLLERALGPDGVAAVPDAPAALVSLLADADTVPDWVRRDDVERGAAVWRRWGSMLFVVAGVTTLEMYTEAAVALPLALAGGYAGANARRRFLETVRFWIEVSQPGALFERGSAGRATALRVRVMHVGVRRTVVASRTGDGPQWDEERWGRPISQAYQTSTLLGGSIAPALALWPLGHLTTPGEIRALLHFQRYLGHLLGVRPSWFPEGVADAARFLLMILCARAHDAERVDAELIESFPAGFAPEPGTRERARLRAGVAHRMIGAYTRLWMAPWTHRRYDLPSGLPWVALPLLRAPVVALADLAGHLVPPVGRLSERAGAVRRERWYAAHAAGAGSSRTRPDPPSPTAR